MGSARPRQVLGDCTKSSSGSVVFPQAELHSWIWFNSFHHHISVLPPWAAVCSNKDFFTPMTTTNDSSNGSADTPEKEPATSRSTRGTRGKRATAAGGIVKASPKSSDVMVLPDDTRVAETDSLPNHRPISLGSFEIVGTIDRAGVRPIGANTFEISTTDTLPGHRPIEVSTMHISDLHTLPGDRPIAPNEIDPSPSVLMGYLD